MTLAGREWEFGEVSILPGSLSAPRKKIRILVVKKWKLVVGLETYRVCHGHHPWTGHCRGPLQPRPPSDDLADLGLLGCNDISFSENAAPLLIRAFRRCSV